MYFNRVEQPSGSVNKPILLLLLLLLLLIVSLFSVNTYVCICVYMCVLMCVFLPFISSLNTVQVRFNNFRSFLFDDQGLHSFLSFSV